jgi:hypothetical protein
MVVGDNWDTIKNVMLKHDWVNTKMVRLESGLPASTINRTLRTHVSRGDIKREFRHFNTSESYNKMGTAKRYQFQWSLIK